MFLKSIQREKITSIEETSSDDHVTQEMVDNLSNPESIVINEGLGLNIDLLNSLQGILDDDLNDREKVREFL